MGKFTIKGRAATSGGDAKLVAIIKAAAAQSPYDVEFFSGNAPRASRDSRHVKKQAVDVVLRDPNTGKAIPNLRASGTAFEIYQNFANTARAIQKKNYPDMNNQFRWGGYFRQGKPGDLMHFDFKPGAPMAAGSWEGGLNEIGEKLYAGFDDPQVLASGSPQYSAPLPGDVLSGGQVTATGAIDQIAPLPQTPSEVLALSRAAAPPATFQDAVSGAFGASGGLMSQDALSATPSLVTGKAPVGGSDTRFSRERGITPKQGAIADYVVPRPFEDRPRGPIAPAALPARVETQPASQVQFTAPRFTRDMLDPRRIEATDPFGITQQAQPIPPRVQFTAPTFNTSMLDPRPIEATDPFAPRDTSDIGYTSRPPVNQRIAGGIDRTVQMPLGARPDVRIPAMPGDTGAIPTQTPTHDRGYAIESGFRQAPQDRLPATGALPFDPNQSVQMPFSYMFDQNQVAPTLAAQTSALPDITGPVDLTGGLTQQVAPIPMPRIQRKGPLDLGGVRLGGLPGLVQRVDQAAANASGTFGSNYDNLLQQIMTQNRNVRQPGEPARYVQTSQGIQEVGSRQGTRGRTVSQNPWFNRVTGV